VTNVLRPVTGKRIVILNEDNSVSMDMVNENKACYVRPSMVFVYGAIVGAMGLVYDTFAGGKARAGKEDRESE